MKSGTPANLDLQNLVDLIDELRAAGYDIGTQQYIAAQNLLIALAAGGELPRDLRSLRTWLAPVICSSPREQESFYRYFDRWIARHPELTTAGPVDPKSSKQSIDAEPMKRRWRDAFGNPAFVPVLVLVLIAVGVLLLFWLRPRVQQLSGAVIDSDTNQQISGAAISFNGQDKTTDSSGGFSISYRSQELPKDLVVENAGYETAIYTVKTDTKSPLEIRLQQPQPTPSVSPNPAGTPAPSPTATPIGL